MQAHTPVVSQQPFPYALLSLVLAIVCIVRRKQAIGGWLLWFLSGIVLSGIASLIALVSDYRHYLPMSWDDLKLYLEADILLKVEVKRPTSQPIFKISARQETFQHLRYCTVCYKKDAGALHPNTPAANRLPRSSSPCQSCSLGCWVPEITSTAPSAPMRAQST